MSKIITRDELQQQAQAWRAQKRRIVFTNGCYDILHAGHVQLLEVAKSFGDVLVLGLNSDASVRRLKGDARPINAQDARAFVLAALEAVDAVCIFEEDTPVETIQILRPDIHVKGGDYTPDELPEATAVRADGGEIRIVPLREGFSTTKTLVKLSAVEIDRTSAHIIIPARWASTRFPGKPLAELNGTTVIERVVVAALQTSAQKPVWVATDDERIARVVEEKFDANDARVARTSPDCATGTDRLAEALPQVTEPSSGRAVIINLQGDEPFINPRHVDELLQLMREDECLQMATLATPILESAQETDPNVVKVVRAQNGDALYFSRSSVPFAREGTATFYRHIGIYAYDAQWLLQMAKLPPTPLEETEKLEQLRALENGVAIRVAVVNDVVPIAIDTPEDLEKAREYISTVEISRTQEH
jgi:3-deoxy-manno-octulosonate cytidylyltransferase (CMP-KDO synthetase)